MSLGNKEKETRNGPNTLLVDSGHIFSHNMKTIKPLGISISTFIMEVFVIDTKVWRGKAAYSKHFPRQKLGLCNLLFKDS